MNSFQNNSGSDHLPGTLDTRSSSRWGSSSIVAVIGGLGEMGKLFCRFFESFGYRVLCADLDTHISPRQAIEEADIVIFAVPLHRTVKIMRELVPYTRPDQLLMDLTSIKTAPVLEMLASPASVVGLHPMFGGRITSFHGQTVVACPARIEKEEWAIIRSLFTERQISIRECTPEEHDKMMSIIQVLFHMTTMLTGRALRQLEVDIPQTLEFTSPSYRLEMDLLGRMFAQSPALYSAITQMNPYTKEILAVLKDGLEQYEKWYDRRDLDGFITDFQRSAAHIGDFCGTAYDESSKILDFSVGLVNNKKDGKAC